MDFPVLYKLNTSNGNIQEWHIYTRGSTIITEWGVQGGTKQTATDFVSTGKNIGRSNETTAEQQAESEAKSRWEKKCKKHYVADLSKAQAGEVDANFVQGGIAPMLAHNFDKQGHKISWPALAQPKLDGHRCVAVVENGVCTLWSRSQKPITSMPHIIAEIEANISDGFNGVRGPNVTIVLDGELYNHDYRDKFEELTKLIRPPDPRSGKENVQYHVYDIIDDVHDQNTRQLALNTIANNPAWKYVKFVDTLLVEDEAEMNDAFVEWEEAGYEGAILRNRDALYKHKRSYDLQKVKNFNDAEYEVIDVVQGRGKMEGKAIFVCKTDAGDTFNVKMMGALDDLEAYLDDKDYWIGQELTVKFQGITNGGVPRFPVGLRFRSDV